MPAIEVVQLSANEGAHHKGDLSILFAASGDLRCFLKTFAEFSEDFTGNLTVKLNDWDLDIMIRNITIILLLAYGGDDGIDTLIHVWYSARLRPDHVQQLDRHVKPIVDKILPFCSDKRSTEVAGITVKLGGTFFPIALTKNQWSYFAARLAVFPDPQQAAKSRSDVLNRHKDHLHNLYLAITKDCHRREALEHFRERGILIPFGSSDKDFIVPNFDWPLHGWSDDDRVNYSRDTHLPGLSNDHYGQLYHALVHVAGRAKAFLLNRGMHLTATCKSAVNLHHVCHRTMIAVPQYVALVQEVRDGVKFDRIDISNIADQDYVGIHGSLGAFTGMLNPTNPHATLITLFMNAILRNVTKADVAEHTELVPKFYSPYFEKLFPYLNDHPTMLQNYTSAAVTRLLPYEAMFERFMNKVDFREAGDASGMRMKEKNTYRSDTTLPGTIQA
ncbi:Hypothetical protein D9617_23g005280 [Elsinoe fawcettii]|nr:Hypothetical protein D9617_23g005280 [Elsinoe fawcettii]